MGKATAGDHGVGCGGNPGNAVQVFQPLQCPREGAGHAGDRIMRRGIGGGQADEEFINPGIHQAMAVIQIGQPHPVRLNADMGEAGLARQPGNGWQVGA